MIKKNEKHTIIIDDIGVNGEGIGKIDGFAVFIKGAIPADKLLVHILKVNNRYAFAKIDEIIEPSPYRIESKCEKALSCGGCQTPFLHYDEQIKMKLKKINDCLERIGGFKNIQATKMIAMDNPYYYRNKTKYPVGIKNGQAVLGFYSPKSHNIIEAIDCVIQHPINNNIVKIIKEWIYDNNISIYNEKTKKGTLKHIVTRITKKDDIMVCLVINGKKLPHSEKLVEMLLEINGMKTIVLNEKSVHNNVIMGDKFTTLYGEGVIYDIIKDLEFRISPESFFQVNNVQTERLYDTVLDFLNLTGSETVIDLFCGIGTISLFLARMCKEVIGVEYVKNAVVDAEFNANHNNIKNVSFFAGDCKDVLLTLISENNIKPDAIVLDPPRKGCDMSVLESILALQCKKIVYVSCDPATLARDLKILADGGYVIDNVVGVDMFPWTYHVETVVLLSKLKSTTSI